MPYSKSWLLNLKKENNISGKVIIFDVGSADGNEFLKLAEEENIEVYAFEPLPDQYKKIVNKTSYLNNFNIYNVAVSNYEGKSSFNVCDEINFRTSSLKNYDKNADETWKNCWSGRFKDSKITEEWKFVKKIDVNVIKLENFLEKNNINHIDYLHCDTQGNDYEVIFDLILKNKIFEGVIECNTFENRPLYDGQKSVYFIENFLKENNYKVIKKNEQAKDLSLNRGLETNLYFRLIV